MAARPTLTALGRDATGGLSGRMTVRLVQLLRQNGRDAQTICEALGLSLAELSSPSARVPYAAADALVEACVRELGAGISVELAGIFDATTYDAAALVLMSSPSFGEGLARAFAFQRLWGDGERFSMHSTDGGAAIRFRHPGPSAVARVVLSELALLETFGGAVRLVSGAARPLAVRFAHEAPAAPLAAVFGVAPSYGAAENELVFAQATLDAPIRVPPGSLERAHELLAQRALAALPAKVSFASRVRAICDDDPTALGSSLVDIAMRLKTSERTLQRHLRAEGTSWGDIVDDLRRTLARELSRRGANEKEIAFLLGFSDPSGLTRARRRWV